ncbi:metalloprotease [Infundibulicybe gibba]|nr:metalloprotease [Infundibulicybe gibba]
MPSFYMFLGLTLLVIACPKLVSGRPPISYYPLAPNSNESRIAPSKYVTYHPLVSGESRIPPSKYATHRSHVVAHGRRLESFHPPTTFKTFRDGIDQPPPLGFGPTTLKEMAVVITQSQLGINSTNIRFRSGFSEGLDTYAYVRQSHEGVPFSNAVANVALHNNKIVAFGSSFVEITNIAAPAPSLDVQSVIPNAENALNGKFNGRTPTLEYLVQPDGSTALTHVIQIQNDKTGTWFAASMDAHSGDILSVIDFVARASYKVVPITEENLSTGGQATLVDPQDTYSSPNGWHNRSRKVTEGNNVSTFEITRSGAHLTVRETKPGLVFDYTYMDTLDPRVGQNAKAAHTNAFYVLNTMHDITYKYGFKEQSSNFQKDNFGKGGLDNDPIAVHVQAGVGANNADFVTPPDGQRATCRLYLYYTTSPRRSAAMDNSVIVHEFTHGLTNRLTGGGTSWCLETEEARGLGEGWSDAMAEWIQLKPIPLGLPLPDYTYGEYLTNSAAGLRTYPYSISEITNPLRYSSINTGTLHEHQIGEVWANMLHNVHAALVKEYGFSENAKTDPTIYQGNVVFMHLFIDALSIQPCDPTFLDARDAWIQADQNRNAGVNMCLLWTAFASRGLGVNAAGFVDDSSVPRKCARKAQIKKVKSWFHSLISKPDGQKSTSHEGR